MGLDPRTPGSCPGSKAGAKLLSHPGSPKRFFSKGLLLIDNTPGHSRALMEIYNDIHVDFVPANT